MKKFTKILALACALLMVLSTVSFASPHGVIENEPIEVGYGNVTIDGVIGDDEGYSDPAYMNYDTLGFFWAHNPLSTNATLYYAIDDNGIYIAADIVEGLEAIDERDGADYTGINSFQYSTDFDTIDLDTDTGENEYGWNGDVMGLMFDPLGAILAEGFTVSTDVSAYYMVGLFQGAEGESDYVRVYRSHSYADGEITDEVEGAGMVTENGWRFEVKISWDSIIADTDEATIGMVTLTKEAILKNGALIRTNAMYQDRFFDEEQGGVATWGRITTVPATLIDGTPGHLSSGEGVVSYGIQLYLDIPVDIEFPDVPEDAWYNKAVYYCAGKGYISGNDKGEFNPDGKLTREAFVSILQRFSGEVLPTYTESPFTDVKVTDWYAPYVLWAAEKGYVKGVGDGTKFGVGQSMDRQQIATMFFRYAEAAGQDITGRADLSAYTDGASVASWAVDACAWAVDAGLLKSTSTTALTLAPTMTVTRSQAAQIFMNYDNN